MRSLRVVAALLLLLSPVVLVAQRNLRLGSVAPANSLFDKALKGMSADTQEATDGRVRIRVQSMGQGGEATIVRRLKLGTTHAAALTAPGLGEIDDAFNVLTIPFFFESDRETRHVIEALEPRFERTLEAEGLVLINWGHVGWAHLFTAGPVRTLEDLKETKLYTSAGDDRTVRWYRQNGFDPVPLEINDVPMGLNTGLINAFPSPPYLAMLVQYYRSAPNMLDLPLGPIVAATVMNARTWARLSAGDREVLLAAGKRVEESLWVDVPRQDSEAVDEMKTRGLTVTMLDEAAVNEFRHVADEMTASMRGGIVPSDVFDLALRVRNSFRGL